MAANEPSPKQSRKPLIFRTLISIGAILGLLALVIGLIALVWVGYSYPWTGFGSFTVPKSDTEEFISAKTLWDWLELLIVPIVLAGGALLFNWTNTREERKTAQQREKIDRDIASDNSQEALLQSYLDRMTDLLLKNDLHTSTEDSEVRAVATARTITVLRRLDSRRRTSLLTFLRESKLIDKDSIGLLRGAKLDDVDLSNTKLDEIDFTHASLLRTNLSGSSMFRTVWTNASLIDANLSGAEMIGADLTNTYIQNTIMTNALLGGATLTYSILINVDMSGADLKDADLHDIYLGTVILTGAKYNTSTKWPDDFTPPPNAVKVET